jgi:transcription initiation factor TFIIH subunit 3
MNDQIKDQVQSIVLKSMEEALYSDSLIAGAMTMALCYLNRMDKEHELREETLSSRILVIKGSEDNPEQYMNFMNAVFTAQKQNVVIDACILDNDSGLLQQACDITGGIYLKIPQVTGLLQYLLVITPNLTTLLPHYLKLR